MKKIEFEIIYRKCWVMLTPRMLLLFHLFTHRLVFEYIEYSKKANGKTEKFY